MKTKGNKYIYWAQKHWRICILLMIFASIIYRRAFMFNMILFMLVAIACFIWALFVFFQNEKYDITLKLTWLDLFVIIFGFIICFFYVVNGVRFYIGLDTITW